MGYIDSKIILVGVSDWIVWWALASGNGRAQCYGGIDNVPLILLYFVQLTFFIYFFCIIWLILTGDAGFGCRNTCNKKHNGINFKSCFWVYGQQTKGNEW